MGGLTLQPGESLQQAAVWKLELRGQSCLGGGQPSPVVSKSPSHPVGCDWKGKMLWLTCYRSAHNLFFVICQSGVGIRVGTSSVSPGSSVNLGCAFAHFFSLGLSVMEAASLLPWRKDPYPK